MIYYLIFCTQAHVGSVCIAPTPMPNQAACLFMLKQQNDLAAKETYEGGHAGRCVGVKR